MKSFGLFLKLFVGLSLALLYPYPVWSGGPIPFLFFPLNQSTQICDTNNSGYVQGITVAYPSLTSASKTFSLPNSAGNLIVVSVGFGDATNSVTSISDTAGNTYTLAVGPTRGTSTLYTYYAKNIVAASNNTITVNFSTSVVGVLLMAFEYSGYDINSPLDGTSVGTGSTTNIAPPSLLTSHACDLLYNVTWTMGNVSVGDTNFKYRSFTSGDYAQERVVSSTGSYGASMTQVGNDGYTTQLLAFKKNLGIHPLPFAYMKQAMSEYNGASTSTLRFLAAQKAGNMILLVVNWYDGTGTVSSVSDTSGNTYSLISGPIRSSGLTQYIYYAKNIAAAAPGANQITVSLSASKLQDNMAIEYEGLSPTNPFDVSSSNTGTGSALSVGPTATTNFSRELIVGVFMGTNNGLAYVTPSSGFSMDFSPWRAEHFVLSKVVNSTGTQTITATGNTSISEWIFQALTFH